MCLGSLRHGSHFLKRCFGAPVGDILSDRAGEKGGFLKYDTDLRAERIEGYFADILPVDQDSPVGDIIEARDQGDDG